MRLSNIIKDYLTFNKMEQRGIFVLLTLLLMLVVANALTPVVLRPKSVDMTGFEKEIAAFELSVRRGDSLEELERKAKFIKFQTFPGKLVWDSVGGNKIKSKDNFIIELNAADTFELQRIRGIGPSFARRIIKYREKLGGFFEESQLLEIWGFDQTKYNSVKDYLTVRYDSIHKINLNTVTFKQLLSHPYFPFETTKAILLYRKEHKKFESVSELKSIRIISDSAFRKIRMYVKVN
jgi:competence ComEA-like helix-hairpin-helix protein